MATPRSAQLHPFARLAAGALLLVGACAASGCLAPRVYALATGAKKERYEARLEAVTRATQRESGALVVCVETLTRDDVREQVHFEVPLDKLAALRERSSLAYARDGGFDSAASAETAALRYVFFADQLKEGCPEGEREVPIRTASSAAGSPETGVYAMAAEKGLAVRYQSPEVLWSSVRVVELAPVLGGERPVQGEGQPFYWLVLPFAALLDGLLFFLYIR